MKNNVLSLVALGLIWTVLTRGNPSSLIIGAPCIFLSMYLLKLQAPKKINPISLNSRAILQVTLFFLWNSARAGLDVLKKSISPKLKISPAIITYPTNPKKTIENAFLSTLISAMPGTLSINYTGKALEVHVLDATQDNHSEIKKLHEKIQKCISVKKGKK